ncbi:hypothetical protein [Parafilimonas sp.]|uniref:hypothetical protein n=1 Tax=Parafilimonas sp. TaxID=1969739 RepID=UPI003F7D99EE
MNYKTLLAVVVIVIVAACNNSQPLQPVADTGVTNLNAIISELPDKPGYTTFKRNCMSCHSARYIQMQPDFPEKTWATIVNKMQKNYGAPVPDSSVQEIVQYLVSIKGKG